MKNFWTDWIAGIVVFTLVTLYERGEGEPWSVDEGGKDGLWRLKGWLTGILSKR